MPLLLHYYSAAMRSNRARIHTTDSSSKVLNFNTYSTGLGPSRPAEDTRVRLREPKFGALVVHRPATAPPAERERTHLLIREFLVADGADVAVIDLSSFHRAPC